MRGKRTIFLVLIGLVAAAVTRAQPGRGGSQWMTARADAQRTSWIRADDKISVDSMGTAGFELQWTATLDNRPRGAYGLGAGVTAAGVTLFVPMSVVTGSSNNVYGIDNDIGYTVWQRHFDVQVPPPTPQCPGGLTAGATRIVRLDGSATAAAPGLNFGRGAVGYRSLVGEPGEGVPAEGRPSARGAAAGGGVEGAAAGRGAGRGQAPGRPPVPGARSGQAAERIPGAPRREESASPFGFLFRESGVSYVVTSDGMLHVLGLPSGKDMQRPAPFLPANSKWSAPVAVGTTLYASTSAGCGGAPDAVWAIDLDREPKPVVSWKTNGGPVVGAVAFTSEGTLLAAVGSGQTSGAGKANAIVALDPKTLQLKDWFTQPGAEFVTGPTILRLEGKEIAAAATKDGRIILLDASSLGGSDHSTPLLASKPFLGTGGRVSGDALAAWQQTAPTGAATTGNGAAQDSSAAGRTLPSWILLPVSGPLSADVGVRNGPVRSGAVLALQLTDAAGSLSLRAGWASHDLSAPAAPIIVNGVVFALAAGRSAAGATGSGAVLHAYDGASGKRLWHSGRAISGVASPGSLWSGLGQVYIGMQDGTLHAFGFNDERRHTNER